MPKRPAPLPQAKAVRQLETGYYNLFKALSPDLLALDPLGFTEMAAARLMRRAKRLMAHLDSQAVRWPLQIMPRVYRESYDASVTRLKDLGATRGRRKMARTNERTKEAAMDEVTTHLLKANKSILRKIALYVSMVRRESGKFKAAAAEFQAFDVGGIEEIVEQVLGEAIREGLSRGKLDQLLRVHFRRELFERKWIRINGRNYDLIKYARLVGRTRIRKLQSEAVINSCREYDNDLVEVSDHNTVCSVCIPYEGKVYSLSGKSNTYPKLKKFPPWHPNCKHSIRGTSEAAIRVRQKYQQEAA